MIQNVKGSEYMSYSNAKKEKYLLWLDSNRRLDSEKQSKLEMKNAEYSTFIAALKNSLLWPLVYFLFKRDADSRAKKNISNMSKLTTSPLYEKTT